MIGAMCKNRLQRKRDVRKCPRTPREVCGYGGPSFGNSSGASAPRQCPCAIGPSTGRRSTPSCTGCFCLFTKKCSLFLS